MSRTSWTSTKVFSETWAVSELPFLKNTCILEDIIDMDAKWERDTFWVHYITILCTFAGVPTLRACMICGEGSGMRATVPRKERACSSSTSFFFMRSISSRTQFSEPQAGNASNKGCLSQQRMNMTFDNCGVHFHRDG